MKRFVKNALLAAMLVVAASISGFAWSDVGHKITGYIAWQRMSPEARENVIKLLRAAPEDSHLAAYYQSFGVQSEADKQLEYFMLVPTWADIVRDRSFPVRFEKYNKSDWHYYSVFWREIDGKPVLTPNKPADGQAVAKLGETAGQLRDAAVNDKDKAIALAWFLHIGGDIHQPLHTSSRQTELEPNGDLGGNRFLITPQGTPREGERNLHAFWDSIVSLNIPYDLGLCEGCYVRHVAEGMMSRYPFESERSALALGKYDEWHQESLDLAMNEAFRDLKRFEAPTNEYRRKAYAISERRLILAGYRMGETLNEIFGK
ncbi:S1/P1 nuclease [soil metagenome]